MKRINFTICLIFLCFSHAFSQSMEKPIVPTPDMHKLKKTHHFRLGHSYSGHSNGRGMGGSMGLFDWNFSLGYIDKTANENLPGREPAQLNTDGQFAMFHLQESVLSNYFLAKKYHKDKRIKFGFQDTFDLGVKRGVAVDKTSNLATSTTLGSGDLSSFFNYQAGLAVVIKVNSLIDVGYTYYPYVNSIFSPDTKAYAKARLRCGPLMGEYSFNGKNSFELKYLAKRKLYIGLSYTQYNQNFYDAGYISNVNTHWYHFSLGRVF
jgi:hypothetical protein